MVNLFAPLVLLSASVGLVLADPQVTLNDNQVVTGVSQDGVEAFLGLPFAQPPLGNLRFKRPVAYNGTYYNFQANKLPSSCLAINPDGILTAVKNLITPFNPILNQMGPFIGGLTSTIETSEDCLYLSVYRPRDTPKDAKLPVMVWLYGGAYIFGTGSTYDGGHYVKASQRINQPVITVTFNYRLGPFGFLGGSAVAAEGNGNAALLDQRMVLEWIQDHIADFGGDPSKVTLFGESSGAMSIFSQMVAKDGDHSYKGKPLFRGAIMQSGSANVFGSITDKVPQEQYQRFANAAGCQNLNDQDTMSCLRSKPSDVLEKAANSYNIFDKYGIAPMFIGFSPRADGDFITKPVMDLLSENKIAKIPYITGVNEDEGTILGFVPNSFTSLDWNAFLDTYLSRSTAEQKQKISTIFPNSPPQGCPYRTGYLNAVTSQYKRFSSLFNDLIFTVGRRKLLAQSPEVRKWTYFSEALHNVAPVLGTFHANDIVWQWFVDAGPFRVYQDFFIAFANHLDPNVGVSLTDWPEYTTSSKTTLNIKFNSLGLSRDTFREQQNSYIIDNYKDYRM